MLLSSGSELSSKSSKSFEDSKSSWNKQNTEKCLDIKEHVCELCCQWLECDDEKSNFSYKCLILWPDDIYPNEVTDYLRANFLKWCII